MSKPAINLARESWFSDPAVQRIYALLNADGGEVRIVGGAARNALMGEPVGDIDMATTLVPGEVTARAEKAGIKVVPTGIDHGTVTLLINGQGFEITTLRRDVKPMGRHAEVEFGTDWQADAERRDFTINALYVDAKGDVIDPVGGLADIETKTIRFIGEAARRIEEDHLRILRFFRFFAWYGGGRPDAEGLKASVRLKTSLAHLSAERIWKELKRLLEAPDPGRALLWMRQSGVLTELLPETEKWGIDAVSGLLSAERDMGWRVDPMLRLMAMLPPDAVRMKTLGERLKMSRDETARLADWALTSAPPADLSGTALDRLMYRHGAGPVTDRLRLSIATLRARPGGPDADGMIELGKFGKLLARAEKWVKPAFPLTGKDLIAAGIEPGEALGRKLKTAEYHWIEGNFALGKEALVAFALAEGRR